MPAEEQARFQIGHVLFIDIVGYSQLLIEEQKERLDQLTKIVLGTAQVRDSTDEQLVRLPTGDGMALVFRHSAEEPAWCALEIAESLRKHPEIPVRMGIHSGPVSEVTDVSGRSNLAGAGINMAQRVMDCGDAGHILLSQHVADDLAQYRQWAPRLRDLGECEVKHGVRLHLVNLYAAPLGNPEPPEKFRQIGASAPTASSVLKPKRMPWHEIVIALLFVAAVIAAAFFYLRKGAPPSSASAAVPEKSVAVLPFSNLSDDKQNAFFTDGVQDQILTALAKVADLKVISRTSVMSYKSDSQRNPREIGQQLGVAHLLEGSVQRAGNKVRVNAQLINARTDAHEWAENYDRSVDDVFAIQSEIATTIAAQLRAKLSPEEKSAIELRPTADVIAFDLYSRAKNLNLMAGGNTTTVERNARPAIDFLNQAVARDPAFLLAHCQLALFHDRLYFLSIDRTPARLAQAQAALDAAARLQPEAGETHLARAYHLYWGFRDYPGALAELEKARVSLPNEARISELRGYILRRQGKYEEGLRFLERALELDPRNFVMLSQIGGSYEDLRRYREAAAIYERALSIYPDNFDAQLARAAVDLSWKAQARPLRRLYDDLRQRDPVAFKERAVEVFQLSIAERDAAAADAALTAMGDEPFRNNALVYNAQANAGLVAQLSGNQKKARVAYAAALEEQEKTVQAEPYAGPPLALLAFYQAQLGRKEEALRNGRKSLELLPVEKDSFNGALLIRVFAATAARVGEKDLALEHLTRATQLPGGPVYGDLKLDPDWDPLRGDPRFEKIVQSLAPK